MCFLFCRYSGPSLRCGEGRGRGREGEGGGGGQEEGSAEEARGELLIKSKIRKAFSYFSRQNVETTCETHFI